MYYVGSKPVAAWAVTTSEGIILIDTLYEYSVEDEIVNGLKKLGLDPTKIKYVVVTHGHADHYAGAPYLQSRLGARILMSAADWEFMQSQRNPNRPTRDMVVTDGQRLTLGDATLTLYLTPGHTPGTISLLVPVKDGGREHLAAMWAERRLISPERRKTSEPTAIPRSASPTSWEKPLWTLSSQTIRIIAE